MSDKKPTKSRLIRTLLGAAIGFFLHMLTITVGLGVAQIVGMMVNSNQSAEGLFWGLLLAFFFSPAGITVGAITGFAGTAERSWLSTTLFGALPALLIGACVSISFLAVADAPNFMVGSAVGVSGLLIAAVVAALTRAKP